MLFQFIILLLAVDTRQMHPMIATILRSSIPVRLQHRQHIRRKCSVGCGQQGVLHSYTVVLFNESIKLIRKVILQGKLFRNFKETMVVYLKALPSYLLRNNKRYFKQQGKPVLCCMYRAFYRESKPKNAQDN